MPPPPSPDALAFGVRLRALRTARGWTQAQLAVFAGCSTGYVGHLEQGRRVPHLKMIYALARALGVSVQALRA